MLEHLPSYLHQLPRSRRKQKRQRLYQSISSISIWIKCSICLGSLKRRKKQKKAKEAETLPIDQFNIDMDKVLDMFRKPQKEKVVEVEPSRSKSKKVTVDDDVMKQVNKKMEDMIKMLVAQQAEITKFKQNEEKMLQIVVASKSNQDDINDKIKLIEAKNEKLERKCERN